MVADAVLDGIDVINVAGDVRDDQGGAYLGTNMFGYQSFGGVFDPKHKQIAIFGFVILTIGIFVFGFGFGDSDKTSICCSSPSYLGLGWDLLKFK